MVTYFGKHYMRNGVQTMEKRRTEAMQTLLRVITNVETVEECAALFDDLCTIKELQDMSQRLEAAALLAKGVSYQNISAQLGISTTTITRVNRCLQYGAGGYRTALGKLEAEKA